MTEERKQFMDKIKRELPERILQFLSKFFKTGDITDAMVILFPTPNNRPTQVVLNRVTRKNKRQLAQRIKTIKDKISNLNSATDNRGVEIIRQKVENRRLLDILDKLYKEYNNEYKFSYENNTVDRDIDRLYNPVARPKNENDDSRFSILRRTLNGENVKPPSDNELPEYFKTHRTKIYEPPRRTNATRFNDTDIKFYISKLKEKLTSKNNSLSNEESDIVKRQITEKIIKLEKELLDREQRNLNTQLLFKRQFENERNKPLQNPPLLPQAEPKPWSLW
jgi:hypothetical protein